MCFISEEKQSLDAAERKRTDMMLVSKTKRNFILLLALCAAASGTGGWLLFQKVIPEHYFGGYCLIPVYFFLFGLFSIGVFDMCRRRAPQKMLLAYLALKALKLISSVMLMVIHCVAMPEDTKAFLLTFAAFYLLYLLFETGFFFAFEMNLKQKHCNKKGNESVA